ncbi:hypothetical protein ACH4F6_37705 [Streptomyces sp. NPDC017936]|uniref:hypothetical protein n=1 Tax=Streptomyces sp. NPDC017936 TaxID=3365016 RepID=UPI0037B8D22A
MTTEEPRGARTHAVPLPEARRVKRAIDSLETGLDVRRPAGAQHPMGDAGYAAQYLGMLKGLVAQVEEGLRGGPLQTDVQKGWFAAYERDVPSMLANTAAQLRSLSEFARQGIVQVPHASQQMSVAAAALLAAHHAFAAASEIAVGVGSPDFHDDEVIKQSEEMYAAADMLTDYVTQKRAEGL